jgi:hypothetical protein
MPIHPPPPRPPPPPPRLPPQYPIHAPHEMSTAPPQPRQAMTDNESHSYSEMNSTSRLPVHPSVPPESFISGTQQNSYTPVHRQPWTAPPPSQPLPPTFPSPTPAPSMQHHHALHHVTATPPPISSLPIGSRVHPPHLQQNIQSTNGQSLAIPSGSRISPYVSNSQNSSSMRTSNLISQYPPPPLPPPPNLPLPMVPPPTGSGSGARLLASMSHSSSSHLPSPPPPPSPPTRVARDEKSKIDPSLLPRVPLFTGQQQQQQPNQTFASTLPPVYYPRLALQESSVVGSSAVQPPPTAYLPYMVVDDGNASPELIRSTCFVFPRDRSIWHQTGDIPLGLVCTPLAVTSGRTGPTHGQYHMEDRFVPEPRIFPDGSVSLDDDMNLDNSSTASRGHISDSSQTSVGRNGIPVLRGSMSSSTDDNSSGTFNHLWSKSATTRHKQPSTPSVSTMVPPRCRSCQAYMNPFFGITDSVGNMCNFCGTRNSDITQEMRHVGDYTDAFRYGTVEYVVGGLSPVNTVTDDDIGQVDNSPYVTRNTPVQPVSLYAIDLTCPHVRHYLPLLVNVARAWSHHAHRQPVNQLAVAMRSLSSSSSSLPISNGVGNTTDTVTYPYAPRIGVCFFAASGIYIRPTTYTGRDSRASNSNRNAQLLHYSIVADITEDPFCSLPLKRWTFDIATPVGLIAFERYLLHEIEQDMDALQNDVRQFKSKSNLNGSELSCGGAALAMLVDALQNTGGRATLITWRRPNYGVGAIPHRDEPLSIEMSKRKDYHMFTPLQVQARHQNAVKTSEKHAAQFYEKLSEACVTARVAVDVLMHSPFDSLLQQPFLDLATLSELCRTSGGNLAWISTADWTDLFREELSRQVISFHGWDAVLKVRVSDGIRIKRILTAPGTLVADTLSDLPELEMSTVSSRTSIAIELEHRVGGVPKKFPFVYFQSALLYTTITGQRRVRVSTLALRATNVVNDIYRSVDIGALCTLITRDAVEAIRSPGDAEPDEVRGKVKQSIYQVRQESCVST